MRTAMVVAGLALVTAEGVWAQQPQAATPLAVGAEAPDFTLPAATRDGAGKQVALRDLRGKVVVLAFFYRARTGG